MESSRRGSGATPLSTEENLRRRRERERAHCAAETAEQKEQRLNKRRSRDRALNKNDTLQRLQWEEMSDYRLTVKGIATKTGWYMQGFQWPTCCSSEDKEIPYSISHFGGVKMCYMFGTQEVVEYSWLRSITQWMNEFLRTSAIRITSVLYYLTV